MAYVSETPDDVGTGRATLGVVGVFAAMGLGLAIMAFASAFGVGGVAEDAATDGTTTTGEAAAGATAGLAAALLVLGPFLAIPLVALGAGGWAGTVTRDGVRGMLAGALGTLIGALLALLLIALGFGAGAAAAGVDAVDVGVIDFDVPAGLADQVAFFTTMAGVTYLASTLVTAGLAGLVTGAVLPKYFTRDAVVEERVVARPPARI